MSPPSLSVVAPVAETAAASGDAVLDGRYAEAKTSVWWDIENCAVPRSCDPHLLAQNMSSAIAAAGYTGPVTIWSYGDTTRIAPAVQHALSSTGIALNHVPAGIKDASDKKILVDMLFWAIDNPPPANIMLISGDRDFCNALHKLSMKRYNILLAQPPNVSQALVAAAKNVWRWKSFASGEPPLAVSPYVSCIPNGIASSLDTLGKSISNLEITLPTVSQEPSNFCLEPQRSGTAGITENWLKGKQVRKGANRSENNSSVLKAISDEDNTVDNVSAINSSLVEDADNPNKALLPSSNVEVTLPISSQALLNSSSEPQKSGASGITDSQLKGKKARKGAKQSGNNSSVWRQVIDEDNTDDTVPSSDSSSVKDDDITNQALPSTPVPKTDDTVTLTSPSKEHLPTLPESQKTSTNTANARSKKKSHEPLQGKKAGSSNGHVLNRTSASHSFGSNKNYHQRNHQHGQASQCLTNAARPPVSISDTSAPNFADPSNGTRGGMPHFQQQAYGNYFHNHNVQLGYVDSTNGVPPSPRPYMPADMHNLGQWSSTYYHLPSADIQTSIGQILHALHILKSDKMAPTEANIGDCIHYGDINLPSFDVKMALDNALQYNIVVMHKLGNNITFYIDKNDVLWKYVNLMDANAKYPKEVWDAIYSFLSSTSGQATMMSSKCRYHAASVIKNTCLRTLVLGEILQMLHIAITEKKWIVPHKSGWQPLSINIMVDAVKKSKQ